MKKLLLITLPFLLTACAISEAAEPDTDNIPSVSTVSVTTETVRPQNTYTGIVVSADKTNIVAQTTARIENIHVNIGDNVEKNEVLVSLEDNPEQTMASATLQTSNDLLMASRETLTQLDESKKITLENARISTEKAKLSYDLAVQTVSDLESIRERQITSLESLIETQEASLNLARTNLENSQATGNSLVAGSENSKEQLNIQLSAIEERIEDTREIHKDAEQVAETAKENAEDALDFAEDILDDLENTGASRQDINEAEMQVIIAKNTHELAEENERQIKSQNIAEMEGLLKQKEQVLEQLNGSDIAIDQTNLSVKSETDTLHHQVKLAEKNVQTARTQLEATKAELDRQINVARKQVDLAKAEYEASNINEQRIEQEFNTKISEAKSTIAEIQVSLKQASVQTNYLTVRSPIDGQITKKFVTEGDLVAPGTVLFEIVDINSLEVHFAIPETKRREVEAGQAILLETAGEEIRGTIDRFGAQSSSTARKITVIGELEQTNILQDGQFVKVHVLKEEKNILMLPVEAIQTEYKKDFVFTVTNGTAQKTYIETGELYEDRVEILSGLENGTIVVTTNDLPLKDGVSVTVLN